MMIPFAPIVRWSGAGHVQPQDLGRGHRHPAASTLISMCSCKPQYKRARVVRSRGSGWCRASTGHSVMMSQNACPTSRYAPAGHQLAYCREDDQREPHVASQDSYPRPLTQGSMLFRSAKVLSYLQGPVSIDGGRPLSACRPSLASHSWVLARSLSPHHTSRRPKATARRSFPLFYFDDHPRPFRTRSTER
jgi:hypothetical protein